MTFLVQFVRGARVVIRTAPVEAEDARTALSRAVSCIGTSRWPVNSEAVRVMDDGGRTLLDWSMPPSPRQSSSVASGREAQSNFDVSPRLLSSPRSVEGLGAVGYAAHTNDPHLAVGHAISYAEDGQPQDWKGGFQITAELEPCAGEAQYTIRSADEMSDRVVHAHELREDLGARTRGQ